MKLLGAIDIGGTKIGVALGHEDGTLRAHETFPLVREQGPEAALGEALRRLEVLRGECGREPLHALGAAVPGPFDPRAGAFGEPPNMPGWHGFAVRAWLTEQARCPAAAMNDANASMLAEARWGAARGLRSAVFLTFSTGFGAGLWLDGRLYEGPRGLAGELGHVRLTDEGPVGFGKAGSVEGWLSGPGIEQQARQELERLRQIGGESALNGDELTTESIFLAARGGDAAALGIVDRVGRRLGQTIALLADLFDPELVILGTIGIAHYDLLESRVLQLLREEALPAIAAGLRVEPSALEQRGHRAALAVATRVQ